MTTLQGELMAMLVAATGGSPVGNYQQSVGNQPNQRGGCCCGHGDTVGPLPQPRVVAIVSGAAAVCAAVWRRGKADGATFCGPDTRWLFKQQAKETTQTTTGNAQIA